MGHEAFLFKRNQNASEQCNTKKNEMYSSKEKMHTTVRTETENRIKERAVKKINNGNYVVCGQLLHYNDQKVEILLQPCFESCLPSVDTMPPRFYFYFYTLFPSLNHSLMFTQVELQQN